jgi:replicative superfamily II helicase
MTTEEIERKLTSLESDSFIQNMIAQANSRYILFNTQEGRENFPPYTIQDENLNLLALYYLELGCCYAENQDMESARGPLEKGSSILEFVHGANTNKTEFSSYYSLIASLGYYVSFQYSKAFILVQKTKTDTAIGNIVALFLQRNFQLLQTEIEQILVDPTNTDDFIDEFDDENSGADKVYVITIARALNNLVRYLQTGFPELLANAKENLKLLKEIAEVRQEPGMWWVVRLLILLAEGFDLSALWPALSLHFDTSLDVINKYIKSLVYLPPRGIHELFITQRKSLEKVLNNESLGAIVTIPTSSGKTRIAEIAIVNSFIKNPTGKVLYIAPFRSLAFEIENTLERVLSTVGISLSHLYGGGLYSTLDEKIIEESNVFIATPEKAKAILRGNRDLAVALKLIIIDEGHLLGANKRLIVNEMFYEELRFFAEKHNARFLLLSAVLPNAEDLSKWLTKSHQTIYKDNWRPSDERLGVLEWNGKSVNLNWTSTDQERPSFNSRFVVSEQLPLQKGQRKQRVFPSNKNEAVAATAFKLRTFGTVLIFVGLQTSVFGMAEAYIKCLGNDPDDFNWQNKLDWRSYELACIETYGDKNNWLLYARKGILCHHGSLNADVRLPLERLMRNDKPLVIISTSTLGQGVNLGVSTVIFSTLYQSGDLLTSRDFWNIAGRAGRAFIDHESKVLVALDKSDTSTYKARRKTLYEQKNIRNYFDKAKIDIATSGILTMIRSLEIVANDGDIEFERLLQLITENNIQEVGKRAEEIDDALDWIDDTLLSLHELHNRSENEDYDWIDSFFRNSLAFIQLRSQPTLNEENLLAFFKARVVGIVAKVGNDRSKWKSIVRSGIPLNSDLFIESQLKRIVTLVESYNDSDEEVNNKIKLVRGTMKLVREAPLFKEDAKLLQDENLLITLDRWIHGQPYEKVLEWENAEESIAKLFTYKIPWIFNAISKKLRLKNLEDEAEVIEEMAMLIEIGLPNLKAVKIYQAGIRSRISAFELSTFFDDEAWDKSIRDYKMEILNEKNKLQKKVSVYCSEWIDLMSELSTRKMSQIEKIPNFTISNNTMKGITVARNINGLQYLCSIDLTSMLQIDAEDVDFSALNNIQGVFFHFDDSLKAWKLVVDNPYVRINK